MLENIEITLRQCVTTVPVSELIVGFLFIAISDCDSVYSIYTVYEL